MTRFRGGPKNSPASLTRYGAASRWADSAIPPISAQFDKLASMGLDNLELEGPLVHSRVAGSSPAFDDARVVYVAALIMPGGLGGTLWGADEHAERYGESYHEPSQLRERFVPYDKCPPIVRATLPAHAPNLLVQLLQSLAC